jgi:hypothetical protein
MIVTPCNIAAGYQRTSPWRWRQHGPPKRWYPTATLHGVRTQKTSSWIFTADKTSDHCTLSLASPYLHNFSQINFNIILGHTCPNRLRGTTSLLCNRYGGFLPWNKAAGTWSSPLSSAEIKHAWSYTSTHPYAFIKHMKLIRGVVRS